MLENVFAETRVVQGEKALSIKYAPRTVSECCVTEEDRLAVESHLRNERYFAVHSASGCGATCCVECIAREMGTFFIHKLTCSVGCTEIVKLLRLNMKNVLLALQMNSRRVIFFIKDIEIMKRNERSQITNVIEESNVCAVLFFNDALFHTKWRTVTLSPPTLYDKMVHLCWICAEEEFDLGIEEIEHLANFADLRNAINALALRDAGQVGERDYGDLEPFSKIMFCHETFDCKDIEQLATFTDSLCVMDIADYKPTRHWFTEVTADYASRNDFKYRHKQSMVARNAQTTHRVTTMKNACQLLAIDIRELSSYAILYRHTLLKANVNPLVSTRTPDYTEKAKALYTIAKLGATSVQCKQMKRALGI